MDHNAYQLLALGARYWFVLLAAVLVWRGAAALLHEHYQRKKLLKKLPDAGMVGEMRDIDNDRAYPLPREGVLGGGSACDIRLRGLCRRDINFAFVEGKGLLLTPCHSRGGVLLDGAPLGKGGYALHGAMLRVGGYTLRIRLFAGLNVPRPAPYEEHWHSAYEDEELYAPEYAAAQLGCAPYSEGAYDQPGMPVPPAFQAFDTLSMPAVNAAARLSRSRAGSLCPARAARLSCADGLSRRPAGGGRRRARALRRGHVCAKGGGNPRAL